MRLKIKFFSILREETGTKEKEVEITGENPKIKDLLDLLEIGNLEERIRNGLILVAKNFEYTSTTSEIKDGDEIAFFPPVSGG